MKVSLLSYTADALDLLLFTKQTRLAQTPGLLAEIKGWPLEKKMAELDYMLGTIHSSWEFVNYTFHIDGVTRAFTHQLVRTRHGSYAQQSQRTVDMSGFEFYFPGMAFDEGGVRNTHPLTSDYRHWLGDKVSHYDDTNPSNWYDIAMDVVDLAYQKMIEGGTPPQDARGILPTNIATNIVCAFNLRTLSDMAKLRLCTRTQGEYQEVFRAMRRAVIDVHPWAEPFIRVHCAALGVCAFPHYKECPIKPPVFNPDTGRRWDEAFDYETAGSSSQLYSIATPKRAATREEIQRTWEETFYEAVPKSAVKP